MPTAAAQVATQADGMAGVSTSFPMLPDAPSETLARGEAAGAAAALDGQRTHSGTTLKMAGHYDRYILPGQPAPKLSAHDKFVMGVKDAISPLSEIGWVIDAGYDQITNGSPNYGQTGKGFAQRLGAGAARDSSEDIFYISVLSPILHEDPRYYKVGSGRNFFYRALYAATRPVVTRTDGGHTTLNLGEIAGDVGGAALTNLYYPQVNRGFTETAKTFGGSLGGDAVGYLASEFLSDTLQILHLKHAQ